MNPLSFSTLACPDWSINTVITKAVEFGYDAIEWRGGLAGHVKPTLPPTEITALRKMSNDAGLAALAITTYTSFVSHLPEERQANVDELRRYADLAAEVDATYIRVFLGELPEGAHIDSSLYKNISDCLNAACKYAESVGVKIAVEPHGDFARSSLVSPIFDRDSSHPELRVIWDIGNTFAAGEDPAASFELLRDRLAYVQVKDGKRLESGWQLSRLGEGHVPLMRAFELLFAYGYKGAFSVEWEYAWHPELDPPQIALPDSLRVVRGLLAETCSS
jgi:sugar phosphate isomerase/epimerase